jgi:hypothetical protein
LPFLEENGVSAMKQVSGVFSHFYCVGFPGLAALIMSVGPSWAGAPGPAPLVGVTGPVGLLAAGAVYGSYLLFKRFRRPG